MYAIKSNRESPTFEPFVDRAPSSRRIITYSYYVRLMLSPHLLPVAVSSARGVVDRHTVAGFIHVLTQGHGQLHNIVGNTMLSSLHRKALESSGDELDQQPLLSPTQQLTPTHLHSPHSRTSHLIPTAVISSSPSSSSTLLSSLSRHLRLSLIRLHALLIPLPAALSSRPSLLLPLLVLCCLLCSYLLYVSPLSFCLLPAPLYYALHPTPPATSATAWMDPRESALLDRTIQQQRDVKGDSSSSSSASGSGGLFMLEYGSGASSFYFSRRPGVGTYVSIEHDSGWCEQMVQRAAAEAQGREVWVMRLDGDIAAALDGKAQITETILYNSTAASPTASTASTPSSPSTRLHFYCVPPSLPPPSSFSSIVACLLHIPSPLSRYSSYVHAARYLTTTRYHSPADIVLVDGRARPQCAYHVLPPAVLQPSTGRVIMHDWNERWRYHEVLRWYDVVESQVESRQPGGGGLVVLKRKEGVEGVGGKELDGLPDWWW